METPVTQQILFSNDYYQKIVFKPSNKNILF